MSLDLPGFADPVAEAQSCFRAVLAATSRPGTIMAAGHGLVPPPPMQPATAAVLLTLVDADTPLWLDAGLAEAWDWLAFHCGAPKAAIDAAALRAPIRCRRSPTCILEPTWRRSLPRR